MKRVTSIIVMLITFITSGQTSQEITATSHFNIDSNSKAIDGYDLVTYFENDEPKEGKKQYRQEYNGVSYYFISDANRQKFVTNPEKYMPQYGGWCAYAMGDNGEKVTANPETYKIVDGKLYVFYNKFFTNTRTSWNKNESQLKANADKNWATIIQ